MSPLDNRSQKIALRRRMMNQVNLVMVLTIGEAISDTRGYPGWR